MTSSQQSREQPSTVPPFKSNGDGDVLPDDRGVQGSATSNEINNLEGVGLGGLGIGSGGLGIGLGLGGVGVGLEGVGAGIGIEGVGKEVGTSSSDNDDDDVERQLQALGDALEESMEMLVESFVLRCSNPAPTLPGMDANAGSVLPVPILISLLRVAVSSKGSLRPQVNQLTNSELP